MILNLDINLAQKYSSPSQKIRVVTERWVANQIYCPNCGNLKMQQYENNRPVTDFSCVNCREDFELKSKQSVFDKRVVDGAYGTMIECLRRNQNPNFFLLQYDPTNFLVQNFMVIPKHFFTPSIIEKRKPLALSAQRAGWIGCNILMKGIPQNGKIYFIKDKNIEPKEKVLEKWKKTLFLRSENEMSSKGWLIDIIACIEKLGRKNFHLEDIYAFEAELHLKHPDNNYIKDKIRQQLQVLRDKGYLDFVEKGQYSLI